MKLAIRPTTTRLPGRGPIGWDLQRRIRFRSPRLSDDRLADLLEKEGLVGLVGTTPKTLAYGAEASLLAQRELERLCAVVLRPSEASIPVVLPYWELDQIIETANPRLEAFTYDRFYTYRSEDGRFGQGETVVGDAIANTKPLASPAAALAAALVSVRLDRGRVGIETRGITFDVLSEISSILPEVSLIPADLLVKRLIAVKSPEEIQALRTAAIIAEHSLHTVAASIKVGDSERDLVERYRDEVVSRGAATTFAIIKGGRESSLVHMPASTLPLEKGDVIRFDVGCRWSGYNADVGRSFLLDEEPAGRPAMIYSALRAGQQAAFEKIAPGVEVRDVFRAAIDAVRREGLKPYDRGFVGHGIGLEIHGHPFLTEQGTDLLEEGMVLMVEIPYYEMGNGGYQIEDAVLVTADGIERLTHGSSTLVAE